MIANENSVAEYKQSLSEKREIVQSVAAFASAHGGVVFVGVSPAGERIGVEIGANTLENLANEIKQNTQPSQAPHIAFDEVNGRSVIEIHVEESPIKPVSAYYCPFKRVGRTNQKLSPEETFRLGEKTRGRSWDAMPCAGFNFRDLERDALQRFLRRADQNMGADAQTALRSFGLLCGEADDEFSSVAEPSVANAGALLFAANPQIFFPEAIVKCARFDGTRATRFLDEKTFEGDVISQIELAISFVTRNTRQAIVITGKPEHDTVPEYPKAAIREAIINAVCHRDYASVGTVQVRIYDDRLEIWNPGMLPPGLTVEALYGEHPSLPRNPLLARALNRARIIEHFGTGTQRIVEACEAQGMPRPEFISETEMFKVRFQGVATRLFLDLTGLTERQRRAVAHVQEHGKISTGEFAHLVGISERAARKHLSSLVEKEVFQYRNLGPKSHYVLRPGWLPGQEGSG